MHDTDRLFEVESVGPVAPMVQAVIGSAGRGAPRSGTRPAGLAELKFIADHVMDDWLLLAIEEVEAAQRGGRP